MAPLTIDETGRLPSIEWYRYDEVEREVRRFDDVATSASSNGVSPEKHPLHWNTTGDIASRSPRKIAKTEDVVRRPTSSPN